MSFNFVPCKRATVSQADVLRYVPAAERQSSSADVDGHRTANFKIYSPLSKVKRSGTACHKPSLLFPM